MSSLLAAVMPSLASAQATTASSTGTAAGIVVSTPAATVISTQAAAVAPSTAPASLAPSSAPVSAQAAPKAEAPAVARPWVIGEIAVSGSKNVKASVVRSSVKARKGDLYDRPDLDRDIQSLLGLGDFERVGADVTATGKPVPSQWSKVAGSSTTVKLTFLVKERPFIRKIAFLGNKKLSKGVLGDAVTLKTKDPLDTVKLHEDARAVLDKYHEKGFLDAAVESAVAIDTQTLQADVTFTINESTKSAIFWVWVKGVKSFKENKILKQMTNRRKKVFVEKDLPEDAKKIETFYLNRGFLDVQVSTPSVLVSEDRTRIYIDVAVDEGRSYRFGGTSFSGNMIYTSTELVKTVEYSRGKIFNNEKYEDTIRGIQELYAEKGRLRARVSPVKAFNSTTTLMDVHFAITEGDACYIDHVDVEGNKATKTYVLAREVAVKPGQVFQASLIRKSREKIMNLGFIDDVDVDIQSPTDPSKVDLTFDVTEGKPGMLSAGAAYSSVDGLVGTLSLQHMNLFGRAQRASVQWSFGKRVQDYSLSWTTPWIGDHPTSLGADLFNTRRISPFQSSYSAYTQKSTGGTIRLGPRFQDDKYQLSFSYTFSRIRLTDIQTQFQNTLQAGTSNYSSASVEFARDTRDNIWDPTRGSRNAIGAALSGGPFLGDISFFKPSLTNSVHFHLFSVEDYPLVLTFANRGAYITQFGGSREVPVFDRFFLGGQNDLRGYEPTGEVGDPSGGKVYDVFSAELGFPLARERRRTIVKFVTFFDMGTAWDNMRSVRPRFGTGSGDVKTDAGFGIRFTTPALPIRLDWGYGFDHRPGEKRYNINFGLGNLF